MFHVGSSQMWLKEGKKPRREQLLESHKKEVHTQLLVTLEQLI